MARLGYVVLHDSWGSLRWNVSERRCVGAPIWLRVTENAQGVKGATLFRSLGAARRAIADTAAYFGSRATRDAEWFVDQCRILPVEADDHA